MGKELLTTTYLYLQELVKATMAARENREMAANMLYEVAHYVLYIYIMSDCGLVSENDKSLMLTICKRTVSDSLYDNITSRQELEEQMESAESIDILFDCFESLFRRSQIIRNHQFVPTIALYCERIEEKINELTHSKREHRRKFYLEQSTAIACFYASDILSQKK